MAITITKQPLLHTPAFNKNVVVATTNAGDVNRFKYELSTTALQATLYAPIFAYQGDISLGDAQGVFTVNGLYSSLLPSFNNPINGITTNFQQIDNFNHQKAVSDKVYEDKIGGATTILNRTIYKAVDTMYEVTGGWNAAGTSNYIAYTRDAQNRVVREAFANQYIPFTYYTNLSTSYYIQIENAGGTSNLGLTSLNQKLRTGTFKVLSTHVLNKIKIINSTTSLELIVDFNKYKRKKTLYFLNKFGGWEWINFIDYEAKQLVDKEQLTKYSNMEGDVHIQQSVKEAVVELKLYGKYVNYNNISYLKDLLTSPVVLDEVGTPVRVITSNLQFSGVGMVEPKLTIQYIKENIINF